MARPWHLLSRELTGTTRSLRRSFDESDSCHETFIELKRVGEACHALDDRARRGEILGLRWTDIRDNTLHVGQTVVDSRGKVMFSTPRTGRGTRRVALSPDLLEVLDTHRQRVEVERQQSSDLWVDSGLVFTTSAGTPIHPRNFGRTWYALQDETLTRLRKELEAAGKSVDGEIFPHARFHDLRHLNVSIRRRLGQATSSLPIKSHVPIRHSHCGSIRTCSRGSGNPQPSIWPRRSVTFRVSTTPPEEPQPVDSL
jgi:integrase